MIRTIICAFVLLCAMPTLTLGQGQGIRPPEDLTFCGTPQRDADGGIHRSTAVKRAFEREWPRRRLPVLHRPDGTVERWVIDHVRPLACCGCDAVHNLQWLPEGAWREKTRWERKVYGGRQCSPGCP